MQHLARNGQIDTHDFAVCIRAMFNLDSENAEVIFGGVANIQLGLKTLQAQMSGLTRPQNLELTHYVLSIIRLERRLLKSNSLLAKIRSKIAMAKEQAQHFSVTHENVIANISDLYTQTVSIFQPRILVQGEQQHLMAKGHPEAIRALLLAGIRSCVLWRHLGGGRFQLLFKRNNYLHEAALLLQEHAQSVSTE